MARTHDKIHDGEHLGGAYRAQEEKTMDTTRSIGPVLRPKTFIIAALITLLLIVSVSAMEDFSEAKQLIDAKVPCEDLDQAQMESVGDYVMEQMNPGEAHETMDAMMGGEGSESLRLMHIHLAEQWYCTGALEDMQFYDAAGNWIGGGMMGDTESQLAVGYNGTHPRGGMMAYGMMGGYDGIGMMGGQWLWYGLLWGALAAFIFAAIFWLTYRWLGQPKGPGTTRPQESERKTQQKGKAK